MISESNMVLMDRWQIEFSPGEPKQNHLIQSVYCIVRIFLHQIFLSHSVNQIIMPTSQRHYNKGVIGHSISLVIKSSLCTACAVRKFVSEVVFPSTWHMSSKCKTSQCPFAQVCTKHMSNLVHKYFYVSEIS